MTVKGKFALPDHQELETTKHIMLTCKNKKFEDDRSLRFTFFLLQLNKTRTGDIITLILDGYTANLICTPTDELLYGLSPPDTSSTMRKAMSQAIESQNFTGRIITLRGHLSIQWGNAIVSYLEDTDAPTHQAETWIVEAITQIWLLASKAWEERNSVLTRKRMHTWFNWI